MAAEGGQGANDAEGNDKNPPPVAFSRTPTAVNTGVLNYAQKEDVKIYHSAVKTLYSNSDELYGCTPGDFLDFMHLVGNRANQQGWTNGFLMIPRNINNPGGERTSLIHKHGKLSYGMIKLHKMSYIAGQTRDAQNTVMLYECLMNSLNKQGRLKVQTERDKFHITVPGSNKVFWSGPLLLKVIIDKGSVNSHAALTAIREQMTSLDTYISEIKYNIEMFHAHVKALVEQRHSRGGENQDLTFYLFKAYRTVPGDDFVLYICNLRNEYNKGRIAVTPASLMERVETEYKSLKLENAWNPKGKREEEILALKAQVAKMKKSINNGRRRDTKKDLAHKVRPPGKPKKKGVKDAKFDKARQIKPNNPKKDVMIYQNKKWRWCSKDTGGACEMFVRHKPEECKKKDGTLPSSEKNLGKKGSKKGGKTAAIVVNKMELQQMKDCGELTSPFGDTSRSLDEDDDGEMEVQKMKMGQKY